MSKNVVPMIHVPDVRATVEWYQNLGFHVVATYGNESDNGYSFAIVSFGDGQVMFSQDGEASDKRRREVDLYVYADDVDEIYEQLKDRVDVVEAPHNTFYGMREVIIRDLNRFWITFGEESVFGMLISGVSEESPERVRGAIARGKLRLDTLNSVLAAALAHNKSDEIIKTLKEAGATAPPDIDDATLQSYAGKYRGEQGPLVEITFNEGRLYAAPGGQQPISIWPLDEKTFKPIAFDGSKVYFNVENGKTVGLTFEQDGYKTEMKRLNET